MLIILIRNICLRKQYFLFQITKDPLIKDETMTLTFRIMHAIEMPNPDKLVKFVKGSSDSVRNKDKAAINKDDDIDVVIGPLRHSSHPSKQPDSNTSPDENKNESAKPPEDSVTAVDDRSNLTRIKFHKIR